MRARGLPRPHCGIHPVPNKTLSNLKDRQEPPFSLYTSTLYHTLYKACAHALAISAYRLAPSRPSINHKLMNLCNMQYEQPKADTEDLLLLATGKRKPKSVNRQPGRAGLTGAGRRTRRPRARTAPAYVRIYTLYVRVH